MPRIRRYLYTIIAFMGIQNHGLYFLTIIIISHNSKASLQKNINLSHFMMMNGHNCSRL